MYGSSLQLQSTKILQPILCGIMEAQRSQPMLGMSGNADNLTAVIPHFSLINGSNFSPANCRGNIMSTRRGSWSSPDAGGNCLDAIQKCPTRCRNKGSGLKSRLGAFQWRLNANFPPTVQCQALGKIKQIAFRCVSEGCTLCEDRPWLLTLSRGHQGKKVKFEDAVLNLFINLFLIYQLVQRELKLIRPV